MRRARTSLSQSKTEAGLSERREGWTVMGALSRHGEGGETVGTQAGSMLGLGACRVSRGGLTRHCVVAGVIGALACLLMAASAAPALASWGFHKSFGKVSEPPDFHEPVGVAVDEAGGGSVEAGSFYVGGLFSGLTGFNLADELVSPSSFFGGEAEMSGVAVNPVNHSGVHNVYVVNASEHKIETFDPSTGAQVSSFEIPGTENIFGFWTGVQIASDSHGNVYVPDAPGNKIEVFDETGGAPAGGVAKEIGVGELSEPEGVTIDSAGNVWVADTGAGKIEEFSPTGTLMKEISSPQVQAVALDGSGDVFASIGGEEPQVIEYNPSGTVLAEFGKGVISQVLGLPDGIAVDRTREIVYVADNGKNAVDRFLSWADGTQPATGVSETQATLHGTVEVESGTSISSCEFEYGTTTAYGGSVPCAPGGPYTANTPVSTTLSGLTPGVDYHYRISATGAGGFTQVGEDQAFGPPAVDGESAEAVVTSATAHAHVTILVEGKSTCSVQYVGAAEYATSGYAKATTIPCRTPIGRTPGEYSVATKTIKGLQPNTVYHYRFLTSSQVGTLTGQDETFTTFGVSSFAFDALGQAGEPLTQAGAHPTEMTDTFRLNTSTHRASNGTWVPSATDANPKDVITELPPGLIGDPDATPKCLPYEVAHADCSGATQVGVLEIYTANPGSTTHGGLGLLEPVPIYNLVPPKGLAAQFGARFNGFVTVHIDARVRTGGDYGVTAEVLDSSAGEGVVIPVVTLWGVPAAESHDDAECVNNGEKYFCGRSCPAPGKVNEEGPCHERGPLVPFLSNPTACSGEREARMSVEPWQEDDPAVVVPASARMPAITGCGKLGFKPSVAVVPTSRASDSPSGLDVELNVPQNEDPNGLATPDLKDVKVVLPAGVTVNPSSANGMVGCPLLSGKEGHPGQLGIDLENGEPANCPEASKVGKVRIKSSLLEEELEGGVYLAQQNANPFKSLLALYVAVQAPERGVVVKLAGHIALNEQTGQLTTTFDENPQLPFEVLELDFFGGERATLATPRSCGSYQPTALLEPWSHQGAAGEEGTPDAEPDIYPFEVSSGPGGSACDGSSFAPSFTAGAVNGQAGAFGSFAMTLQRKDGEQRFSTISIAMPLGLAGMISKVSQCANAQAEAGDCPAASKIGHVNAEAGVGDQPVALPEAGKGEDPVYLTEKYDGAPFGLSIVVPAEAGPFNLGTVIVRARIMIDPHTGQVTVISNAMPNMLQGVPLDVKTIHVEVNNPNFIFNPTNCQELHVDGTIGSAEGAKATVSSRFQVANCAALPFKPVLTAETHAHHTHKRGAFLKVSIKAAQGQANLAKVDVTLPKRLPADLATLKKACTGAQFDANPAGCPKEATVGSVVVHTPVLSKPLTGPAIFVSHGGAQFPDLALVLQGEGITIIQEGSTSISKDFTTNSFNAIPDLPVSSVEVTLPESTTPALGDSDRSLCTQTVTKRIKQKIHGKTVYRERRVKQRLKLIMPTTITGQNGAVIQQNTTMLVRGCPTR
jgi:SMP-30/Gluconolactonase/LRE-like region